MKQKYTLEQALNAVERKKKRATIAGVVIVASCIAALPLIRIANNELEKMREARNAEEMKGPFFKAMRCAGTGLFLAMGVPFIIVCFLPTKNEITLADFINQSNEGSEPEANGQDR